MLFGDAFKIYKAPPVTRNTKSADCAHTYAWAYLYLKMAKLCVRQGPSVHVCVFGMLTSLLAHSTAKQLQRTAEQTHYSGSLILTHTHTCKDTRSRPAVTSENQTTLFTISGKGQRMEELLDIESQKKYWRDYFKQKVGERKVRFVRRKILSVSVVTRGGQ